MINLPRVLHGMQQIKIHGLPDFPSSPPQRGGFNANLGDHDISTSHNPRCIITLLHKRAHMNRMVIKARLRAWSSMSLDYPSRPMTTQNLISIFYGTAFG